MRLLQAIGEKLRNHTRDAICDDLRCLGLNAQMAPRGRWEEMRSGSFGRSLGLITIPQGPIQWINIQEYSDEFYLDYYVIFGIPDSRLGDRSLGKFKINCFNVLKIPLVGVIKLSWKGNDLGLGIVDRLSGDESVTSFLAASRYVEIRAFTGFWTISVDVRGGKFFDGRPRFATRERWDCYQAIAGHLLAEFPETR